MNVKRVLSVKYEGRMINVPSKCYLCEINCLQSWCVYKINFKICSIKELTEDRQLLALSKAQVDYLILIINIRNHTCPLKDKLKCFVNITFHLNELIPNVHFLTNC